MHGIQQISYWEQRKIPYELIKLNIILTAIEPGLSYLIPGSNFVKERWKATIIICGVD